MAQNPLTHKIKVLSNDVEILQFKYKNLSIEQNSYNDLFYLQSIEDLIRGILNTSLGIEQFMKTYVFYSELCLFDSSLTNYKNVYILKFEDEKIFKIGNTFNMSSRYSAQTREHLVKMVPVKNPTVVEKRLINFYKSHYTRARGNEYFNYDNFDKVLREFDSIVSEYGTIKYDYKKSKLISTQKASQEMHGMWVSKEIAQILVNHYIHDENTLNDFREMIRLINLSYKDETYEAYGFNNQLNTRCLYWKFHKYTVIQNDSDLYINGSRLVNSIKKADNIKTKKTIKSILQLKYMEDLLKQIKEKYGNDKVLYYYHENKDQPYLSGYYVHFIVVHSIVHELSASYRFVVSELTYRLFRDGVLPSTGMVGGSLMTKDDYNKRYMELASKQMPFQQLCALLNL